MADLKRIELWLKRLLMSLSYMFWVQAAWLVVADSICSVLDHAEKISLDPAGASWRILIQSNYATGSALLDFCQSAAALMASHVVLKSLPSDSRTVLNRILYFLMGIVYELKTASLISPWFALEHCLIEGSEGCLLNTLLGAAADSLQEAAHGISTACLYYKLSIVCASLKTLCLPCPPIQGAKQALSDDHTRMRSAWPAAVVRSIQPQALRVLCSALLMLPDLHSIGLNSSANSNFHPDTVRSARTNGLFIVSASLTLSAVMPDLFHCQQQETTMPLLPQTLVNGARLGCPVLEVLIQILPSIAGMMKKTWHLSSSKPEPTSNKAKAHYELLHLLLELLKSQPHKALRDFWLPVSTACLNIAADILSGVK